MGKRTRWREAHRQEAELRICAVLEANSRRDARARAPERYSEFKYEYGCKIQALRSYALRAPEDWRCRIKSRSEERRFLDLVRFTFERYRVAAHLERAWFEDIENDFADSIDLPRRPATRPVGAPDLRRWYIAAAQGGSLYKQETSRYLTRQETHHFLTTPNAISSSKQALWYAIARPHTDSTAIACGIAYCKITNYSIGSTFWKEVAHFFARNPLPVHGMNDLVDFLYAAKQEDQSFDLKGRTLASLQRKMEDWHRELRREQTICGGAWAGSPLPDVDFAAGSEEKPAIWRFRQIKTGNALFREGERMHHCVVTYKAACMRGDISIWSLTCEFPIGQVNRGVTMEVTKDGRIVQCRGFANRLPYANEATMVKRWALEHALTWASPER